MSKNKLMWAIDNKDYTLFDFMSLSNTNYNYTIMKGNSMIIHVYFVLLIHILNPILLQILIFHVIMYSCYLPLEMKYLSIWKPNSCQNQ